MNESPGSRDAYLVLEIEYVPSSTSDFREAIPLYLDVAGYCTDSAVPVPEGEEVFDKSIEWTIGYPGEILGVWGHLHDGGTKQEVELNGEALCEHVARYGESEEYITHVGMFDEEPADGEGGESEEEVEDEEGHGHDHSSSDHLVHISSMTYCQDVGERRFETGDVFSVKAYYDLAVHEPMAGHHGGLEPVMGISMAYVVKDESEAAAEEE